MAEVNYVLDSVQQQTPDDVVTLLNNNYQYDYRKLLDKEKRKNKDLVKEVRRCKRHQRAISFRRLLSFLCVLLFLVSSLIYSGFAATKGIGLVIIGMLAITLIIDLIFFFLVIFRWMYLRTALTAAYVLLTVCAAAIALLAVIAFKLMTYLIVVGALLFLLIANFTRRLTRYKVRNQIFPFIMTFAAIFFAVICTSGAFVRSTDDISIERELYSRFASYDTVGVSETKYATLTGVMLTANDLLSYDDGQIYKVDEKVPSIGEVTTVDSWAFRDANAISTVVLPASVTALNAKAFEGSRVQTVEIHASIIYIEDGFTGSSVRVVKLLSNNLTSVAIPEKYTVPENITFYVPKDLLELTREINPDIADQILALPE